MKALIDLLRGQVTPAWITGTLRGAAEAAALAGLAEIAIAVGGLDFGSYGVPALAGLAWLARTLEAWIDHIDPIKRRAIAMTKQQIESVASTGWRQ